MNPDLRLCWRCKKPFNPEASEFWPNMSVTCPACIREILPVVNQLARGGYSASGVPDRLLADVTGSPVAQAEAILAGRRGL